MIRRRSKQSEETARCGVQVPEKTAAPYVVVGDSAFFLGSSNAGDVPPLRTQLGWNTERRCRGKWPSSLDKRRF